MTDRCNTAQARAWALTAALITSFILILILGLQARSRILKHQRQGGAGVTAQVNDFQRWMVMVPQFLDQHADYQSDSFPTPPITLLAFAPFTHLSPANAQLAWALCKWPFILAIAWAASAMIRRAGIQPTLPALGLVTLVWLFPVIGDIQEGQTNLLMLLPLTLGLWAAQRGESSAPDTTASPAWQLLAGLLVALAICIKVTPLIFLPYFLWRRRWWVAAGIAFGCLLWLVVVPGLAFGSSQNLKWLDQWYQIMIVPYLAHGQVDYFVGQSIPSFVSRLLRHVPAFKMDNVIPPQDVYVNLVDLPESLVNGIIRGILGALGLAGLWWMRRRLATLASPRYVLEIGAVAIFMLWASQRTWVPHYVSIALACAAATLILSDSRESDRFRRHAGLAILAAAGLMLMTSDVARIFGKWGGEWMRTLGVSLLASLLLLLVMLRSRAGRAA